MKRKKGSGRESGRDDGLGFQGVTDTKPAAANPAARRIRRESLDRLYKERVDEVVQLNERIRALEAELDTCDRIAKEQFARADRAEARALTNLEARKKAEARVVKKEREIQRLFSLRRVEAREREED